MTCIETPLKGCFVITPTVIEDSRGYFFESYNKQKFESQIGATVNFVQDNQSKSSKGVLRGLHLQTGKFAQAKLVRVLQGKVLDVCVDLRKDSKTYGQHFAIELDAVNKKQLFVPRGFAHGFLVLENETIFSYKCDNVYNKASEGGVIYNDKTLNINWGISEKNLILSEKDKELPAFADF